MTEYPKRLYLGPYRFPVTVETAEQEAAQRAAFEPAPEPKRSARHDDREPADEATPKKGTGR